MTNLYEIGLIDACKGLKNKEFTSQELTQSCVDQVEKQKKLNLFSDFDADRALDAAKQADARLASGEGGTLEGVPIGVKDLFCTKGVSATSCSKILGDFKPPYESTVTTNLFSQGAVMLGKLNMDEFAMGSANLNSRYGPAKNPWKRQGDNADLVPGGSSGASAASVAANICPGSLGSDTGGSIRQPAAFCGVVGVKPTYGRCSRYGMIAFASSLDQAGVFARSVEDSAVLLESICGYDLKDSTSVDKPLENLTSALGASVKGKKVGIPKEYYQDGMLEDIENLWQQGKAWLKDAGAELMDVSLPHTKYALPAYYIIAPAEASSNLARYDGVRYGSREWQEGDSLDDMYEKTRAAGFGDEVKRRIMIGTYVLSAGYYDAYYKKAQQIRTLISEDFNNVFADVDVILTPTTPTAAFGVGEKMDPIMMYLNDVFTVPASLAGLPGVSVPAGFNSQGLPLGLQLIGKPFAEAEMFTFAHALEQAAGFKGLREAA